MDNENDNKEGLPTEVYIDGREEPTEEPQAEDIPEPRRISKKPIIMTIAVLIVAVIGSVTWIALSRKSSRENAEPPVAIEDLTDEQRTKLGIAKTEDKSATASATEDEHNYSDEYKAYLELSDEEKSKIEAIPRKETIPDSVIKEIKEDTDDEITSALPSKFDLRDKIEITVGNQGSYGLCWDYAASTSLETYLKLRGVDYNPSEFQVDFLSSNLMYGNRDLQSGGNFRYYTDIASAVGTMSEAKFSSLAIDLNSDYYNGTDYNYLQLAKNEDPIYITKTVEFPSMNKENGDPIDKTEAELEEFRNLVKAHIMTNGSLYTATASPWGWDIGRYCETSKSGCWADHAMSIIGWDDTYPKENFATIDQDGNRTNGMPKHDGAYLVLNSWGEDWDGSGAKGGAFYISYDEYNIEAQLSGVASTSLDDAVKLSTLGSNAAESIIREKLSFYIMEYGGEEYISESALDQVTYLELESRGLDNSDLEAIVASFPHLSSLGLRNNNISDSSPLAKLENLYRIDLSENHLTDISSLCSLTDLSDIDLSHNNIRDISCLAAQNNEFSRLNISGNVGVTGFEKFTNLVSLTADGIGLEDLTALSELEKLSMLSVRDNNISGLKGLSSNIKTLYQLDLSGNKITDLSTSVTISQLGIENNNLSDAAVLNDISANAVNAANNNFSDLSGLKNESIVSLSISGNKGLASLPELASLRSLNLSDCGLDSLEILKDSAEKLPNLTALVLANNHISSLAGLEGYKSLRYINADNNNLTTLDELAPLEGLNQISADNNSISSLDGLLELEDLSFLSLNSNQLTAVPKFAKSSSIYMALAKNPIRRAVIPSGVSVISLQDCDLESIDYAEADVLNNVILTGNPGWSEYHGLITAALDNQTNSGKDYPYISVTTDYAFGDDELAVFGDISDGYNNANWYLRLEEYNGVLKKSSDGSIDLEAIPERRRAFMAAMKSGLAFTDFTIDRAATKITPTSDTLEKISLEGYNRLGGNPHVITYKTSFVLE